MKLLLVDTSVWSLILRRRNPRVNSKREGAAIDHLVHAILMRRAATSPTVAAELANGASAVLRAHITHALSRFPLLPLSPGAMARAREIQTSCRKRGVQIGYSDCEILATAEAADALVLSLDKDFEHAERVLGTGLLVILPA